MFFALFDADKSTPFVLLDHVNYAKVENCFISIFFFLFAALVIIFGHVFDLALSRMYLPRCLGIDLEVEGLNATGNQFDE